MSDEHTPHDSVGVWSAATAGVSLAFLIIPVIGDLIALAAALVALGLGIAGIRRFETGRTRRVVVAIVGAVLGLVVTVIAGLMVAVTAAVH